MAVALHRKRLGHFHRAGFRDAPNVVARQVDQHHVFGTFFGVVDQLVFGSEIGFGGGRPWAGASQGADGDLVALGGGFLPHQNFRRSPHHMEVAQVVVIHIGAGVQ